MSSKYKPGEHSIAHFVTFTVVGWIDVFSSAFDYYCNEKGLLPLEKL